MYINVNKIYNGVQEKYSKKSHAWQLFLYMNSRNMISLKAFKDKVLK